MRHALALLVIVVGTPASAQLRDTPFRIEPPAQLQPPSSYRGFETREVKTVSPERLDALRRGLPLRYGYAAAINGYPSPHAVLELTDQLELDAEQQARLRAIIERLRRDSIAVGEALVAAEAHLDRMFALSQATPDRIDAQTAVIAGQEARLRALHLRSHLDMMDLLQPGQIESYSRLRGARLDPAP